MCTSTELLDPIGFQPGSGSGSGYGGVEGRERLARGEYSSMPPGGTHETVGQAPPTLPR